MATTKGVRKYAMVVLMIAFMVCACHQKKVVKREVVHDTVFVDNSLQKKVDTVFYDSKRLRNRFETAKCKKWRNYKDSIAVEYPEFMKYMPDSWERKLHVEYHGVTLLAVAYDDESEKSVQEKYEALNMGAVTKSVSQNSFLLAGNVGDRRLFFEKQNMDVSASGVPFGTDMGYRSFVAICKRLSSEFPAVCRGFMIEPPT